MASPESAVINVAPQAYPFWLDNAAALQLGGWDTAVTVALVLAAARQPDRLQSISVIYPRIPSPSCSTSRLAAS